MSGGFLVTADGEVFEGRPVGVEGVRVGEAVFNTSMTGYQEVLSDPSYAGQVVVMTSPHIGNYGVSDYDDQAARPAARGLVVRARWRGAARRGGGGPQPPAPPGPPAGGGAAPDTPPRPPPPRG
ncbi:MAG: hypothetical protein OXM57_03455, partial [bacterium]|nr:hypothetical protein [bacterium]